MTTLFPIADHLWPAVRASKTFVSLPASENSSGKRKSAFGNDTALICRSPSVTAVQLKGFRQPNWCPWHEPKLATALLGAVARRSSLELLRNPFRAVTPKPPGFPLPQRRPDIPDHAKG